MKFFLIAALVAVAAAAPQYPAGYAAPAYKSYEKYDYKPYDFAYAVKDDYTYNDFGHQESQDANGYVKGSYRVALPDGRLQTVTYTADDYNGYVADVSYTGEAKYPEYKAAYPASYKAPAYPSYPAYPKY